MRSALMAAILLISICFEASAWGRGGHRTVCLTAWAELTEPTRDKIRAVLDVQTGEQFADTCSWADDIRKERPETASWHFFDTPPGTRELNLARDCPQPRSCIVDQIERHGAVVRNNAPKAERAESIKFLAHFVGDVHQPLHVAIIGDQGGNKTSVVFLGTKTNLHAVWDFKLLEVPAPPPDLSYPNLRAALHNLKRKRWKSGTPLEWAQESFWIMQTPSTGYVGNPGGLEFGDIYVKQNYPVAAEQLEKAGVRLGALLQRLFDS